MRGRSFILTGAALWLGGCATMIHGPYQDVEINSSPTGAKATVSALASQRGPAYLDKEKRTVTTPATIRLKRDNTYRVEIEKPGYKIATAQVDSQYDWLWAPALCGVPCEAVAQLPSADMKNKALPLRFAESAFYSYPKGFFRAVGYCFRLVNPEALLGTSFKLKQKDEGYFTNFDALGPAVVTATLEPSGR